MKIQNNRFLKQILSIYLVISLLFSMSGIYGITVNASENIFEEVSLSLNSDQVDASSIDVYICNGDYYISIDNLCELARCSQNIDDKIILVTQGFWTATFDFESQSFYDGYQTVPITILKVSENEYAVPALAFLSYFKLIAFIEDGTLYCRMSETTAWEALNVDFKNSLIDIYQLYGGEGNVKLSLILDIIMDFIIGDMSTSENYLGDAFLSALKVNLYDYDSVKKYKKSSQNKLYSDLHSSYGKEFIDAIKDTVSVSVEPVQWYIQHYYNAIEKSFVNLAYDAYEAGQQADVTHYGEKFYEAFTEKNKRGETAKKYFDNADYIMLFVSAAVNTAQQMKYTNATDNLIYNVMGKDNLNYLGISADDNDWFTVANRYQNVLDVSATQLETVAVQFFTDKLCWEILIGTGVSSAAGISDETWTFSLNAARLFAKNFPLTSSSVKAFQADRSALYLSELQRNVYWIANNILLNMQGQWDNIEIYRKYIQALQLYCRTSIAMYENLITMVGEFGKNQDYWIALFQERIDVLAVSLYQLTAIQDDGMNNCLPLDLSTFKISVDNNNLVNDAYTDAFINGEQVYCYHIPKINLNGNRADLLNARIFNQFYAMLEESVYQSMDKYNYPELSQMVYTWGQKDDLLSLVIQTDATRYADTNFYVYTISTETGEEATPSRIYEAYGLTDVDFYELAKKTMQKYWDDRKDNLASNIGEEFFQSLVVRTLSDENVKSITPYINTKGDLCFIAHIYSLAGADKYLHMLNTMGEPDEGWIECTIDHFPEEKKMGTSEDLSSNEWKEAYINYINEINEHIKTFGLNKDFSPIYKLVNINNDNVPELYINFMSGARGDGIYTYYEGKVIEQHIYNFGFSYIEGKNIFCNNGGHMDEYYHKIYTINNGKFVLLYEGNYGASDNSHVEFDSDGLPVYDYYWNGATVSSKDEYINLLNEAYPTKESISPFDGTQYNSEIGRYEGNGICDYRDIIEAINRFESEAS